MENSVCKKISSMLSLYIENKLAPEARQMIEEHLKECPKCREKYVRMHSVVKNLRSTYEQMLSEFEKIEHQNEFNIREYEVFCSNISPYIDDELSYSECVRFRKYLLKSKPARKGLADAYSLKNILKKSINNYIDNLKINFSKEIIQQLKKERKEPVTMNFRRASLIFGVFILTLSVVFFYLTSTYNNQVSTTTEINQPPMTENFATPEETTTNEATEQNDVEISDNSQSEVRNG